MTVTRYGHIVDRTGASLRRLVRAILRRASLDLVRYNHRSHPIARRMRLLSAHEISIVFDVGANIGQYASQLRTLGYRGRIVSFEPLSDAFERLESEAKRDPLWDAVNVAIGDSAGTATINVAANSYSSSLLKMLPTHLRSAPEAKYVRSEEVAVRTLDSLFGSYVQPNDRSFLKVDTQGYEYRVLQGASEALERLAGLQLEMSIIPLYEGEVQFDELLSHLRSRGFQLMSVEPGFSDPSTGQLLQIDGIFFREYVPRARSLPERGSSRA